MPVAAGQLLQQALFKTSYFCIACAANDQIPSRLMLKQYLAARKIVVRPDGCEHLLDSHLVENGWNRLVMLELSHFMSLISRLPGSGLLATVPQDIATVLGRHVPIQLVQRLFSPPELQVQQHWHRRTHNDLANRWLRGLFCEVNWHEAGMELAG